MQQTNYGNIANPEDVKRAVEASQGVITVSMETLRDAHGAGRLGAIVLSSISKSLLRQGLSHYPKELSTYQHQVVRVYQLGSPIADIIDAAFTPGDENDELLRQAAGGDAAMIVSQIRELVCR